MTAYRLYLLAKTGRILRAIDLMAEDDARAIRDAEAQAAGGLAELWCGKRLVKKFDAPTAKS